MTEAIRIARVLCAWCIAEIAMTDPKNLQIHYTDGRFDSDLWKASLVVKLSEITRAWTDGRTVHLAGRGERRPMDPAVTTWHADPICGYHLVGELQSARPAVRQYRWG